MHQSLKYLLRPASMAIIGANNRGNVGARAVRNAKRCGYSGAIYPVNPKYEEIEGLVCYPSIAELPERPDQVVVAVPAPGALDVVEEAAAAGVPAAVVFSEGFADAGTHAGHALDKALKAVAAAHGMAVSGPNSMGLLSLRGRVGATFINLPRQLKAGGISVVSQSGGLINALAELGRNRDAGFHYLLSAGNESVVNSADYLQWLADDPDTSVIVSILEGIKRGPEFRAALEYATRRKPVVVLKLGSTKLGERATLAHTGSLAGSHAAFRALCQQTGSILTEDVDSLLETALMLDSAPLPKGDRVVIFSTSGGATVLTTDLGVSAGLSFPPLSDSSNAAIQKILEVSRPFTNPFDVVGNPRIVKGDNMTRCLETLIVDDSVDAIAFVLVLQRDPSEQRSHLLKQIHSVAAQSEKPIVVIPEMTAHWHELPPNIGVPVTGSLKEGLHALKALIDYGTYRRKVSVRSDNEAGVPEAALEVTFPDSRRVLTEYESKCVLKEAGFCIPEGQMVRDAEETIAAAQNLGYPVAIKLQSPDLMHKTEAGGLALNLKDARALRAACKDMIRNVREKAPNAALEGFLVEKMASGGVEVFLGMHRDPSFGPVVVFGLGGTFVELLGDAVATRLPPFGRGEAEEMIRSLPAVEKLLAGYRGAPPADRDALVTLIKKFAQFAVGVGPSVAAIDLNPVVVLARGQGTVIVDASFERMRSAT